MASKASETKSNDPTPQSAPATAAPKANLQRPEGFRVKLWEAASEKCKREILALSPAQQERYSSTGVWPETTEEGI